MSHSFSVRRAGRLALPRPPPAGPAWRVAAVVGTLINVYGQLLVPWLNGDERVVAAFLGRARQHPGTTALSVALAYLFPLGVSMYSAAAARRALRRESEGAGPSA